MINKLKRITKVIRYFFMPFRLELFGLYLLMLLAGLMESANLAAIYPIINYGLNQGSQGIIMEVFNALIKVLGFNDYFIGACIVLLMITFIAVLLRFVYLTVSFRLLAKIILKNQYDIFQKLSSSNYDYYVRNKQGQLIYACSTAPAYVTDSVLYTMYFLNDITSFAIITGLLVILSWKATLAVAIVGLLYAFVVKNIMSRIIYGASSRMNNAHSQKNVILNEFISGIRIIKVYSNFIYWVNKYVEVITDYTENYRKVQVASATPSLLIKMIFFVLISVLGVYIRIASGGNIIVLIPLYGTFLLIANRIMPVAQSIGTDLMTITSCLPNAELIYKMLNEKISVVNDGSKEIKKFKHEILFENVGFAYSGGRDRLINGLNLDIKKNTTNAIVGHSGSGKTTLINLLLRLYQPTSGRITIDGEDISELTLDSYLSKIGYVSQETFVYHDTIAENIRFGKSTCTLEEIIEAAKLANAHEFIAQTSEGYNTLIGDAGIKLSGGQRQRLAIARAMLRNPEIIVLDEATSSLDNISEKAVQEAIYNISQNTTVIIIAHRLSTIINADKICVLKKGKIVEAGRHEDLLKKNGEYHKLYNVLSGESSDAEREKEI